MRGSAGEIRGALGELWKRCNVYSRRGWLPVLPISRGTISLIAAIGGLPPGIAALKWKNLAQFSPKKTTMTSLREMNKMARKEIIHWVTRSRIQGHPGLRTHLSFGETRTTSFMLVL